MFWYVWLIIVFVLGFIVGGFLLLCDLVKKLLLSEEQFKCIYECNVELDVQEVKDC